MPRVRRPRVDLDAPIGDDLAKIARRPIGPCVSTLRSRPRSASARRACGRHPGRRCADPIPARWRRGRRDHGRHSRSTGVDLLVGVGGTPEGVLAACALRCLGGEMFGRLIARDDDRAVGDPRCGLRPGPDLTTTDLVSGDNVFFAATGVTDGSLLQGREIREPPHHHAVACRCALDQAPFG